MLVVLVDVGSGIDYVLRVGAMALSQRCDSVGERDLRLHTDLFPFLGRCTSFPSYLFRFTANGEIFKVEIGQS